MSKPSSSSFESIFNAALDDYTKRSGTKLDEHHPLVKQLENCNSVDSVSSVIQEHARRFREFRGEDGKLMKSLKGAVQVLYTLSTSTVLGEGIGIPLPPSKAVFAAFGILLGAVKDVSASYDALIDLFESIKRFLCRLEIYTNIPLTTAMTVIVVEKLAEVLSVLALATKQVKQGRIKKFMMKMVGENDIEALLKRLDRLTQEEGVAAGAQILEDVHHLVEHTRVATDDRRERESTGVVSGGPKNTQNVSIDIKRSLRVELQQNIQRWLSPPDPWKNHNIARESQHTGTATWWIHGETFSKWKCSGMSSLLWLHGKPGAGKSVLCSSIIHDIQGMCVSGQASLAFFYCDFREDQKKDGRGLLSSLLVQLCGQSDAYYDAFLKFYEAHDKGSRHVRDSELAQCLKHVLEIPEQITVYVVIDALDECPKTSLPSPREQVLKLVKELVKSQIPNLRICVTSRPEADIEADLHPLAYHSVSLHGENGQVQDIAEYVKFVVDTDPAMQKWREEDRKHVVEVLMRKADGMFRWVYCQLQYLRQCLRQRIRRALDELPDTLDETYDRTLEEIGKQNGEYAHRLFQCVAAASRPLRVEELAEFLAFEFDTDSTPTLREDWREEDPAHAVRSTCSSLLAIVDVDGSSVIQFAHFSVKEYLTSKRLIESKETISRFHVSMTLAHTIIAQACLGVLLHIDENITKGDLEKFPLARYAAEHLAGHEQFEGVSPKIQDGMKRLLDPSKHHFSIWVWIMLDEIGKQNWEYAHRLFQCVAAASRPLRVEELAEFLAFDFDTDSTPTLREDWREENPAHAVRSTSSSLLAIVDVDGSSVIQFAHFSFKEYLTSKRLAESKETISRFHVSMTLAHTIIAQACLGVLLHIDENITKDDLEKFPLARYAAEHWVGHARFEGVSPRIQDGMKLLFDPSNHHFSIWIWIFHPERGGISDESERTSLAWETPLHLAAFHGLHDIVKFLIVERSQDVNSRDNYGETPLSAASRRGYPEVVRLLLEHGADTETRDNATYSPLERSIEDGHVEVLRVLLEHHADVNFLDEDNWTALHLASGSGEVAVARLLLKNGADANAKTTNHATPLHSALNEGVARVLLEYGADPTPRDEDYWTPLHHALQCNRAEVARLLLENGVDANTRDSRARTLLHLASSRGYLDGVRLLLHHGADIHARDDENRTPFQDASARGHEGVMQLLVEHGAKDHRMQ